MVQLVRSTESTQSGFSFSFHLETNSLSLTETGTALVQLYRLVPSQSAVLFSLKTGAHVSNNKLC